MSVWDETIYFCQLRLEGLKKELLETEDEEIKENINQLIKETEDEISLYQSFE
jgi:hypothetical protein